VISVQAIKTDAVCPFPVILSFGVNYTTVREGEENLPRCVGDADEVVDQQLDRLVNFRLLNALNDRWHIDGTDVTGIGGVELNGRERARCS
jgi:hypothetical protein